MFIRVRYVCRLLCLSVFLPVCLTTTAIVEPSGWGLRIGTWFTASQSTPKSDVIVVLGGSTLERINTSIELYKDGIAPRIVITGHDPDDSEDWEVQGIKNVLDTADIPQNNITWLKTGSTYEDAQRIREQAHIQNWEQILIVSHWYHGRRAICTIKNTLSDDNVQIAFTPAETKITLTNWWRSEDGIAGIITETPKLLYYSVKYRTPLGGCWSDGMDPVKVIALSGLGIPLSLFLVMVIRHYALREKKLDIPNGRSSHTVPTPRGGGIAIVFVTIVLLLIGIADGADMPFKNVLLFVACSVSVAGVGLLDDWWRTLSPRVRLGIHFIIALAFVVGVSAMTEFYLPVLGNLELGMIIGGMLTLFWIVGLINAYNFMDGSDGLAGTQVFLAGSAWALLFFLEGQETLALLAGLLAASSMGFLFLNAPSAKIFMGDVGSTFLGFSFAALSVFAFAEMGNSRLPVTSVLMVGVFVFDAAYTMLRRARNGENLLEAHHSHLYQRLIDMGYSHSSVCTYYAALMTLSAAGGLAFYFTENDAIGLVVLVGILGSYLGLASWVTWLEADHIPGSIPHGELTTDK
ncbi:MAG TPA: ElyC/SanA/YdcF family protein [Aggregatilineaceae bacterium]|nr:ElyC/SanA/YdcF family protein [Aggregatilineaceae bacterium]